MAMLVACKPSNNDPQNPSEDPQPSEDFAGLTEPQKRIVVIEEYTGIKCGYCPSGHKIVNDLIAAYEGRVFGVNIHCGGYADGTYMTADGTKYANDADISGYPAGSVSRHVFAAYSDGGMSMGRSNFEQATKSMLGKSSPVNIKATAEIDKATRTLTVKVKGYYTADPTDANGNPLTSNSLYVLLLQDSVMGEQVDYGSPSYNPDQWIGDKYCHMHMLRDCITETWGDAITPKAGTGFVKDYTYTIPATIGTDQVPATLEHLKVLVFVAEGKREIYTADEPTMVLK